jgi:hypothetical protein
MKLVGFTLFIGLMMLVSCNEISEEYPLEPIVDYQGFGLYISEDELGNKVIVSQITFDFTDGDGNVGLPPLEENSNPLLPDSLKYNFYLQMYDLQGYEFVQVPESEGGFLKYRIPFLNKQPLKGTMDLDISYPVINEYDTIFYTFYIVDRSFNRSNTDTTDVMVLRWIYLDDN